MEFCPLGVMDRAAFRDSWTPGALNLSSLDETWGDWRNGFTHYGNRADLIYARIENSGGLNRWRAYDGNLDTVGGVFINGTWVRKIWIFKTYKIIIVHDDCTPDDPTADARVNWQAGTEPTYPTANEVIQVTMDVDLISTKWDPPGHARYFITALENVYTMTKIGGHYEAPSAGGTADGITKQTPSQDIFGNLRPSEQKVVESKGANDPQNKVAGMFRTVVSRTPASGNRYEYWHCLEFTNDVQANAKTVTINGAKNQITFDGNVLDLDEVT